MSELMFTAAHVAALVAGTSAAARAELDERDAAIASLRTALACQINVVARKNELGREAADALVVMADQLKDAEAKITELRQAGDDKDAEIRNLREHLANKAIALAELSITPGDVERAAAAYRRREQSPEAPTALRLAPRAVNPDLLAELDGLPEPVVDRPGEALADSMFPDGIKPDTVITREMAAVALHRLCPQGLAPTGPAQSDDAERHMRRAKLLTFLSACRAKRETLPDGFAYGGLSRPDAIATVKASLRARSGYSWSVTGGKGTAWGWLRVNVAPKDQAQFSCMAEVDQVWLALLLGHDYPIHQQGESIANSGGHYKQLIAQAAGYNPTVFGEQYWD